jgi:hypothetical protein
MGMENMSESMNGQENSPEVNVEHTSESEKSPEDIIAGAIGPGDLRLRVKEIGENGMIGKWTGEQVLEQLDRYFKGGQDASIVTGKHGIREKAVEFQIRTLQEEFDMKLKVKIDEASNGATNVDALAEVVKTASVIRGSSGERSGEFVAARIKEAGRSGDVSAVTSAFDLRNKVRAILGDRATN